MRGLFSIILVLSISLFAIFVDKERAQKVAENYYENYAPVSAKGNKVTNIFAHKFEGQVTWYGISFDQGFILVTADDGLKPILGYSFEGKLADPSQKDGGSAFKEWFGNYDKQIKAARESSYVDNSAQTEWKNIVNNIFPKASKNVVIDALVRSHWDQVYPWNDLCPEKDGTWTYVGPVATAAAQIMRYHEWPPTGIGSNTHSQAGYETYSNYTFDYTIMNHDVEIEWGLYPIYWESIDMDAAAIQNMAELNYLVGHSFDMWYGTTADGGSGANMGVSATALQNHWYYNTTYTTVGSVTDPAQDAAIIQAELNAKRPWWWAGGVHSFILDGYTDDYWYHFNWGWTGYQDGWFQLNNLVPEAQGDGDYTQSQIRISCVPDTDVFNLNWPSPENFAGQLLNEEDISLIWSSPVGNTPESYNIYKSENFTQAILLINTTDSTYIDENQMIGEYSYYVTAVYSDGESHNTDSYSVSVEGSVLFLVAYGVRATSVGRTNIDLEWNIPFTGTMYEFEDFETGNFSTLWVQKTSDNLKGDSKPVRQFWYEDELNEIRLADATNTDHIVSHGEYACMFSTYAERNLWLFLPEYTYDTGSLIKFWTRFKYGGGPIGDENVIFNVVAYTGNFDEENGVTYDVIGRWDSAIDPVNDWESEWEVSLATLDGQTKRVGFMVEANANDYYTFAIDDILIGSTSSGPMDDPTGYEVYRNDILATTINDSEADNWSDIGFVDGNNEYFIRVLYPTGVSISSEKAIAYMDANPKPDYLTGVINGMDIELSWYMPYGTPSHWSTYIDPQSCTTTVDSDPDQAFMKRRVEFRAEDLGLYYPVTIDSLAAGFYEWDDDLWGANNTFVIRLWDGDPIDGILLYESGTLTATPSEIYTYALPSPHVLNGFWNIEVEIFDSERGHPANLAGPSTSGINSYYYNTEYSSYNYYLTTDDTPLSYCFMAYVTGSEPDPIVKSGWTNDKYFKNKIPTVDNREIKITDLEISSKELDYYKVYRDGLEIGTTTLTSYVDAQPVKGEIEYYVTACYVNPVGESKPSNVISVFTWIPDPDPHTPNVSIIKNDSTYALWWEYYPNHAYTFKIFASDDPYGDFIQVDSLWSPNIWDTFEWEISMKESKKFYYVITYDPFAKEPLKKNKIENSNIK